MFGEFSVYHAVNSNPGDANALASGGNAVELAFVGAVAGRTHHHLVPFRYQIVDHYVPIRKRCNAARAVGPEPLGAHLLSLPAWMLGEIWRKPLIDSGNILLVEDLSSASPVVLLVLLELIHLVSFRISSPS